MSKIELTVADVHSAALPSEAFSLILKEKNGERYVPVIIGMSEARAILVEMHKSPIHRPLTHELFVQLAGKFACDLVQVDIVKYEKGVYFADMQMLGKDNTIFHLDARPSDAIAIALRCNAPFFMNQDIFEANCVLDVEENEEEDTLDFDEDDEMEIPSKTLEQMDTEELNLLLQQAVQEEDYELAARIKEELEKR